MRSSIDNIEILDCTIRDGGYINNWNFSKTQAREIYRAVSKSGVDIIEMGYIGTAKYFDPKKYGIWRFSPKEDLDGAVHGIKGAKISLMADYGKFDIDELCDKSESNVNLIRVAAHKNHIHDALSLLESIKEKGYQTSLQTMGFTSYTEHEKMELRNSIKDSNMDYLYIADSYGSIFPHQIEGIFEPFLDIEHIKIGFHPHNSLQMAFANTLEAIKVGIDIVDGSIYGMGRGAGNLPLEAIVAYMQMQSQDRYNVIPILNVIDKYFIELKEKNSWGYQLPYMLSGMFKCHPNYAKELIDRREYTVEDIWKLMDLIKKRNPVGFDSSIIQKLIEKGIIGCKNHICENSGATSLDLENSNEYKVNIPYIDRHKGRDFLILANGPTLKEYKTKIDDFIQKYNPVVMGANYLAKMFVPDYHAFNNKKRFTMYIDDVNPTSQLLIGENIPQDMIEEYDCKKYETLYFKDIMDSNFEIKAGRIQTNCRTISVLLAGIAIVMGAKRIFIAGMDGYMGTDNLNSTLFYEEQIEPSSEDYLLERHQWNEYFLQKIEEYLLDNGKEGLHILTPTSHRAYYKGIANYI